MNLERLEIARLYHRFGLGPKPGDFHQGMQQGLIATRQELLAVPAVDKGADSVNEPRLTDLGPFPPVKTNARTDFQKEMAQQRVALTLWWLDRLAASDHGLTERMTWFWHGHWATSIGKVEYALPMYLQNQTLRVNALGNFATMSRAMIVDGALQYWLDGGFNTIAAPNENLARELMELFTLGVNHYLEIDVKAVARALTGYNVVRSSGVVTFQPKRHDSSSLTFLGTTGQYDAISLSDFLVARDDNAQFIAERIWFRFICDSQPLPEASPIKSAFSERDISRAINAAATSPAMSDPQYSLVKPPLEWFIAMCRALGITPSKLKNPEQVLNFLDKLGQIPFVPPNVGGWPAGEAWLNAASAQYRLQFAQYLINQGDLSPLKNTPATERVAFLGDLLAVAEWSYRSERVLRDVNDDPARMFLMAVSSPEYLVSV
jgi:uncharacterized protein (DUF1800 family)